ncbi:MAG: creatininase family protein [Candidatus Methanomethyliaceae archaeon]|nr:creatininase family protein [Candidatus Methanomethyliaceae archaeon]
MKIAEMTGSRFDNVDKSVAILPVGSVERHGDHLPLGTDGTIPMFIAERAGEVLKCLVLPVVWYGSCHAMRAFPGTFDIDSETLYRYLKSIMVEAHRNGVKLLVAVNGHGGNTTPISMAAREASRNSDLSIIVLDWWKELGIEKLKIFTSPGHAGEDETSTMLAISKASVDMKRAKAHEVTYPKFKIYSKRIDEELYSIALTGDARKAARKKGEELLDAVVHDLVAIVEETRQMLAL